MSFSIPSNLFNKYNDVVDELIDNINIGVNCTLVYPPKKIVCINCTTRMIGGISNNVYKHGGPAPFNFGSCPLCGGEAYKEQEVTDSIRLRVYWRERDWKTVTSISIPDAGAMVIGYVSDYSKFIKANEILLINDQTHGVWRMNLAGEPFLHGFGKKRYFAAFLNRV